MRTDSNVFKELNDASLTKAQENWKRRREVLMKEIDECDENLFWIEVEQIERRCYSEGVDTASE